VYKNAWKKSHENKINSTVRFFHSKLIVHWDDLLDELPVEKRHLSKWSLSAGFNAGLN